MYFTAIMMRLFYLFYLVIIIFVIYKIFTPLSMNNAIHERNVLIEQINIATTYYCDNHSSYKGCTDDFNYAKKHLYNP